MEQPQDSDRDQLERAYCEAAYTTIQAALAVAATRRDFEIIALQCEGLAGYREADEILCRARHRMDALVGQPDLDEVLARRTTMRAGRGKNALRVLAVVTVVVGLAGTVTVLRRNALTRRFQGTVALNREMLDQYGETEFAAAKAAYAGKAYGDACERLAYAVRQASVRRSVADNARRLAEAAERRRVAEEAERMRVVASRIRSGTLQTGDRVAVDLGGGVAMELVWCGAGSFLMGSPAEEQGRVSDETRHRVTLTQGFWIGQCEVTREQWSRVMRGGSIPPGRVKDPVEQVSWDDCQAFIGNLNRIAGQSAAAGNMRRFRLPTEAEWEFACRAGRTGRYGGTEDLDQLGWHQGNSAGRPHAVGQKRPNAWGLYDMHGNVAEWCQDRYADYPAGAATDPVGPATGAVRVCRGGGWTVSPDCCRSAFRGDLRPDTSASGFGFRLVCGPDLVEPSVAVSDPGATRTEKRPAIRSGHRSLPSPAPNTGLPAQVTPTATQPPRVAAPVSTRAVPANSFARNLRVVAFTTGRSGPFVGFINTTTQRNYFLRVGQTEDGIEVLAIDANHERAHLRKGSEEAWVSMKGVIP